MEGGGDVAWLPHCVEMEGGMCGGGCMCGNRGGGIVIVYAKSH